ncbi:MAG: D-alanine--D-alanine ligase, partial [Oscillospiraceae bacterium]|nr:D-alanine--D-alanine ligase [Oscillospiraceae bacterium]
SFWARALAEPAVEPLREINTAVLGDAGCGISPRASVCEEPVGQDEILSYADKYQSGVKNAGMSGARRVIPADIPPELTERIQSLAVSAFRALGCAGTARVDFLLEARTGTPYINELNTLPGSMAFYLWEKSGLPFAKLLDELVSLAFARHRARAALTFTQNTNLLASANFGKAKGG